MTVEEAREVLGLPPPEPPPESMDDVIEALDHGMAVCDVCGGLDGHRSGCVTGRR